MQLWRINENDVSPVDFGTFESEKELQDLIERNPEILPIDADLMILAREFQCGSGVADFVAVDMQTGQLVIIETKLYRNADRRRVVAQVLDYAADMYDQDVGYLEDQVPVEVWERLGDAGIETLAGSLQTGEFWLVVAMDHVPRQLVDVASYFQNSGARFRLDLVTVKPCSISGEPVLLTGTDFHGVGALARTTSERRVKVRPNGRPLAHSEESIAHARDLRRAGYSLNRITEVTGIPRSSVYRYVGGTGDTVPDLVTED